MSSGIASAFLPRLRGASSELRSPYWWRAVTRDVDTGVLNPAALASVGAAVVRAAARRGEPLSALVVRVLPTPEAVTPDTSLFAGVASVLRECFSADEVVARDRWEMVLLLPATDEAGADEACTRIKAALEADGIDDGLAGTVIVGYATRLPTDGRELAALLARARERVATEAERQRVLR